MKSIEQPSDLLSSFSAGASESVVGAASPSGVSSGVVPVVGASVFAASPLPSSPSSNRKRVGAFPFVRFA